MKWVLLNTQHTCILHVGPATLTKECDKWLEVRSFQQLLFQKKETLVLITCLGVDICDLSHKNYTNRYLFPRLKTTCSCSIASVQTDIATCICLKRIFICLSSRGFQTLLAHDLNLSTISDKIYQMICFSQKNFQVWPQDLYFLWLTLNLY